MGLVNRQCRFTESREIFQFSEIDRKLSRRVVGACNDWLKDAPHRRSTLAVKYLDISSLHQGTNFSLQGNNGSHEDGVGKVVSSFF